MTKLNFDKEKYFFNQECATCKHSSHYQTFAISTDYYCDKLHTHTYKEFVCDFYVLSRSKAKRNLKERDNNYESNR